MHRPVGITNSRNASQSVAALHDLLGSQQTRVALATFVDRDSLVPGAEWSLDTQEVARDLQSATMVIPSFSPSALLLPRQQGDDQFFRFAETEGIPLVVVLDDGAALTVTAVRGP